MERPSEDLRVLRFGPFEANFTTGELCKHGIRLKLQDQPFHVLKMLLARPGELVTREEIRQALWPSGTFVDFDNGLNAAINRLREALGDSAEHPRFIETLPRRGYRFIGALDGSPQTGVQSGVQPTKELAIDLRRLFRPGAVKAAELPVASRKRWKVLVPAALILAAGAIGGSLYFRSRRTPVRLTDRDTIVLSDFNNTTGDSVFDDTLKQGLSVQLEQSPFLAIVSDQQIQRTLQMMDQKSDVKLTPQIASELCQRVGGKAMLTSSIAQIGTRYSLIVKAVNCSSGEVLTSAEAQAGDKNHVLDALSKVATEMRARLGESLKTVQQLDTPLYQATTSSLEALQAFSLNRKASGRGDYNAAVSYAQRAVALDPNFAMAYLSLSAQYSNLGEKGLSATYAKKAYELRGQVSENEKGAIDTYYAWNVTGDLDEVRTLLELRVQTYPRNGRVHFDLGNVYDELGQYEKGNAEASESVRLNPASGLARDYLAMSYLSLNRFSEARDAVKEELAKSPSGTVYLTLYLLAFLENDATGMAQQVRLATGKPGVEDLLLGFDAYTSAYFGQLTKARELSRRAVASAETAKQKETAASHEAGAAVTEALFGNMPEARQLAAAALKRSDGRDMQYTAAVALAIAGDASRAQALADDLATRFPEDTHVVYTYLPAIRAQLALEHRDPAKAIELLQAAGPYELGYRCGLYPIYLRGMADLAAHHSSEALAEFQKIVDHRGIVVNEPIAALAHLQMGRALAMQGDVAKARAKYQDFLNLWKGADSDIPILKQAQAEYAKLK